MPGPAAAAPMRIRKLPALLVNQIAAGEVIERPASVVKELIENSLDAGADRIDIAIEAGGSDLIRISDDGAGIAAEDLPLAVEPHATSKLATAADLEAIGTFGFRGEALASIGSVARLRITSRATADGQLAEAAAVIEVAGEQIHDVRPAAGAPGTIVEVRDLFFNTPARRKFLRAAPTEFGHINDTVARTAMMHPAIAFTLTHNDRKVLDLPATDDRAQRCIDVLGKDLAEALLPFEHRELRTGGEADAQPIGVWGLAGLPSIARANGKAQYLAINGRPIRDRNLAHAVKEAYRGLMPMDKFPVAVVFLTMDPRQVDVNVHPAKAEVRFRNPSAAHGIVLSALRQRLLGADLTPQVDFRSPSFDFRSGPQAESHAPAEPETENRKSKIENPDDFVDYFRRMDPTQKGLVYEEVRRELAKEQPTLVANEDAAPPPSPVASRQTPTTILQVRNSYVVTEDDQGILIVDQHALHERVMFEELRARVLGSGQNLESQRLLMPEQIRANASRQALLEELSSLLARIGIEAAPMGPDTVGVHAFPSFLFSRGVEVVPFMEELLDRAENGDIAAGDATAEEAALHAVLDMMACKAAVKAGDKMTPDELSALLAKRAEVERSSNCPHGRPTTLRLTHADLEKRFGRV
jgi:DNA mismatch repair protein MutL